MIREKLLMLIHEGPADHALGLEINSGLERPMTVLWPDYPLVARGIIRDCEAIVASRFHALVHGVPAVGASWSHKYEELFNDYACPQCLIRTTTGAGDKNEKDLSVITDAMARAEMRVHLTERGAHLKTMTRKMWSDVFQTLQSKTETSGFINV